MKIMVAPNALKGSLTAVQACDAMADGIRLVLPKAHVTKVPVADGGDGLVDVLADALAGKRQKRTVNGPLEGTVEAEFCYVAENRTAVVEMARASGLVLVSPEKRNPLNTGTYGTGELIAEAVKLGAKKLIVGIGGSATNDGGIGMAAALGIKFLDERGQTVKPVGGELQRIRKIDASGLSAEFKHLDVEVVCDVDNPLLGERGAAHVYAPQKGASPWDVEFLDAGLGNLASVIKADLGIDVTGLKGGGAAGGLGAGLHAFLGGRLRRGVDVILDLVKIDDKLKGASLVFTAEGLLDRQTAFGKAPAGVAERAARLNIPCIAIGGGVLEDADELHQHGFTALFSLCRGPITLDEAMKNAAPYLASATAEALRVFLAGRQCQFM